jgi:hypothetical protein
MSPQISESVMDSPAWAVTTPRPETHKLQRRIQRRQRRMANRFLMIGFLLVVAAPLVSLLLRPGVDEEIRTQEQREPSPFPTLKTVKLKHLPSRFEAWFNDHRGFRGELIGLYGQARLAGFVSNNQHQAPGTEDHNQGVLIGRQGWLYLSDYKIKRDYRRSHPFTSEELSHWKSSLTERRDWLAARGIEYVLIIAPDKGEIYPEYLPRSMAPVGDTARIDQLMAECAGSQGIRIVDLRGPVLNMKASQTQDIYSHTDTHWNQLGAYAGYQAIMQEVSTTLPGIPAWKLEEFDIQPGAPMRLDLAQMLGGAFPVLEQPILLSPKSPPHWKQVPARTPEKSSLFIEPTENPQAGRPGIVVVHDSFMLALAPLLNEHFQRVRYTTGRLNAQLIDEEQPAMVIEELVQRKLQDAPPPNPEP